MRLSVGNGEHSLNLVERECHIGFGQRPRLCLQDRGRRPRMAVASPGGIWIRHPLIVIPPLLRARVLPARLQDIGIVGLEGLLGVVEVRVQHIKEGPPPAGPWCRYGLPRFCGGSSRLRCQRSSRDSQHEEHTQANQ